MPVLVGADGDLVDLGDDRVSTHSLPYAGWDGGPFLTGRPISFAKIFATQPWVGIAVMRLLTWSIRVPLKVYRRIDDDGNRERVRPRDHPLARAIATPWDRGSMADLIMGLLGPNLVHGNGLTDVIEGAGGRIRFETIDWRTTMPIRYDEADPNGEILGWKIYEPGGGSHEKSADNVMHLKWWSPLGNIGISPLQQLQTTLEADKAAVGWTINNLKQAARPSGIVEMTEEAMGLEPDDRQQLYEKNVKMLRDAYGGERGAGKLPVLPPGLKWTTADHTTAVEAELMAQRMVNRNEIAAIYMVPPPMIGQLERSTFNNITTLRELAYTDGLAPPLVLIEQAINAHVVAGLLREDDIFVEFDFGLILRGDRLKEIQAIRQAVTSALMTPNEGRAALNHPPSDAPEADELWIPGNNLTPLREAANAKR